MSAPYRPSPYQPSRSLPAKLRRRAVQYVARESAPMALDKAVVSFTFDDVPASVQETALPALEAKGWRGTLYVATGLMDHDTHMGRMMGAPEVLAARDAGHEIAAHSHAHRDCAKMSAVQLADDIARSDAAFDAMGMDVPDNFAWPYGESSVRGKRMLGRKYASLRGIRARAHRGAVDLNQVGSVPLFGSRMKRVMARLDALADTPGWLTLFTHDVREDASPWGCSPAQFQRVVDRVAELGLDVETMATRVRKVRHG